MTMVVARLCWRMLAGGKFGGVLQNVVGCGFGGSGEIFVSSADTDTVTPAGASLPS
jgi:hypothetical protein